MNITEVSVAPIKPQDGLIAFASVVIDESFYLGSIAVYTRANGTYRLLYPTKRAGIRSLDIFHPINRLASKQIEELVFEKCDEIFENENKQQLRIL